MKVITENKGIPIFSQKNWIYQDLYFEFKIEIVWYKSTLEKLYNFDKENIGFLDWIPFNLH